MSKQVTPQELANIVQQLLDPNKHDHIDTREAFIHLFTDLAEVVCNHCGGKVIQAADDWAGEILIGIRGNDDLPPSGGIWANVDPDGDLFDNELPDRMIGIDMDAVGTAILREVSPISMPPGMEIKAHENAPDLVTNDLKLWRFAQIDANGSVIDADALHINVDGGGGFAAYMPGSVIEPPEPFRTGHLSEFKAANSKKDD